MAIIKNKQICSKLVSSHNTTVKGFNTLSIRRITPDNINFLKLEDKPDKLFLSLV